MAVAAITDNYTGERLDRVENFHGNQIVYIGWDHHLMFCAPFALMLPPDLTFGQLVDEHIPGLFSRHPDFANIDWDQVEWRLNGDSFTPDREKSLIDQGVDHKSAIRMATPGLNGVNGSGT